MHDLPSPNLMSKFIPRIEPDQAFEQQSQSVMAVRYSRDATFLVATGGDKLVNVYDVVSSQFCLEVWDEIQPV